MIIFRKSKKYLQFFGRPGRRLLLIVQNSRRPGDSTNQFQ